MLIKTKIALAAALVTATASVALAQDFDPNLANRYPAYAGPVAQQGTMQSAPVRLLQGRNVALPSGKIGIGAQASPFEIDRSDRASSPYAGGGY
jgi:hypothetical protein